MPHSVAYNSYCLPEVHRCKCMCMTVGDAASSGTRSTSRALDKRELPLSDWEIHESEVEICKREDGSLWHLGGGSFGQVFKAIRNGVQPVAGAGTSQAVLVSMS
jgi:hypothetical protein